MFKIGELEVELSRIGIIFQRNTYNGEERAIDTRGIEGTPPPMVQYVFQDGQFIHMIWDDAEFPLTEDSEFKEGILYSKGLHTPDPSIREALNAVADHVGFRVLTTSDAVYFMAPLIDVRYLEGAIKNIHIAEELHKAIYEDHSVRSLARHTSIAELERRFIPA